MRNGKEGKEAVIKVSVLLKSISPLRCVPQDAVSGRARNKASAIAKSVG